MKVVFFSSRIEFEPNSLETRGLGGSESALINLSSALKEKFPSDEIVVYNRNSGKIKEYNNVKWRTLNDFYSEVRNLNCDAFVSLREPKVFLQPFIDTKLKILWSQDNMEDKELRDFFYNKYLNNSIDIIFSVSNYAINDIKKYTKNENIILLRNGYNPNFYDFISVDGKKEDTAIYASTPYRGLDILVETWPYILQGCRDRGIDPKLKIFSSMSLYNQDDLQFNNLFIRAKSLENTEVKYSICQKDLYKELQKAKVMLYPNTYTETSCMSVIEAIASKVWVVTSNKGALGEAVINNKNGYLIDKIPTSDEYKKEFIQKSIESFFVSYHTDKFCGGNTSNTWYNQAILMKQEMIKKLEN